MHRQCWQWHHRPLSLAAEKSGTELLHLEYSYDSVGNVTELIKRWLDPLTQIQQTSTESYGYDALDRLASAVNEFGTISFEYDSVGNRLQQTLNGDTTAYTYQPYDRLATAGEWEFTYDTDGNTLSKTNSTDEWLYQYDATNRLVQVQHNGQLLGTYTYGGNGYRIKKTEWNPDSQQYETIIYLYSRGNVYYEKNTTTGLDAIYIFGPTGRITKEVGEETMYYHTDHLGSTRLITNTAGSPISAVGYHPFGESKVTGENERYLFTGQEMDSTGLYYYKARYYDPEIGRFLSRDKWKGDQRKPQSMNKYIYCMNNPLKYTDPSGSTVDFADEMVEDLLAENEAEPGAGGSESPPDPGKESSCTTDACLLAYNMSRGIAIQLHTTFESKAWLASQNLMREMELILADPEDRKEFEKGWNEGYVDGCADVADPATAEENTRKFRETLDGDMNCLIDHLGDELAISGLQMLIPSPIPTKLPSEILQAAAYIARENYNLAVTDRYGSPPDNLDEFCKEEDKGSSFCFGTFLLCIFSGLGIFSILMKRKRRETL
ncbi:MAG: hypothetical protein HXS46_19460 [Theionarchaea archaeon]|nr:MAG: hypothetical protein AYK18_11585 [Theionarchaea archaeon DG-70]MBU7012867.1 hypothetical protein [Theionarchaea archaeon]